MDAPWSITYHDGSANGFRLASDGDGATYEYIPVTPERSSSGTYSGGAPRQGRLDATQAAALRVRVRELELDPSVHAAARMMMTGAFTVDDEHGKRDFIISSGPRLRAFHEYIDKLTGG